MRSTGFQFNERDLEIVHHAHQLRIATIDHLSALTNRSQKALERRLPKLRDARYLKRLRPRPHKGLYVLGSQGMSALIEGGLASDEFADRRQRQAEWKDLYIPHALLVASIHMKLLLLSRHGSAKLVDWQHDQPRLWDSVETASDGKLPVQPDAYFTLSCGRQCPDKDEPHFFLEADLGTMSHRRIAKKITAYAAYHQQQRHVAKFGISYFQVAIVTQTKTRAKNLRAEFHPAMSTAQRRAYHFIPLEDLTLELLLAVTTDRAAA